MAGLVTKIAVIILATLLFAACSGKIISRDQDGGVVNFKVGTSFQIHLQCPAEEEYYWKETGINRQILELLGPPEVTVSPQQNKSLKTYIFHFRTSNPGNALLKFYLFGADSTIDNPLDDFEIMITSGSMG
jgi:hypothetical protein